MTDTVLKAVPMQPGIIRDVTNYTAEGGWVDCDHIRWRNSRPEKIGGWVRESTTKAEPETYFSSAFSSAFQTDSQNTYFTGVARAIMAWSALDFSKYLLVASHTKLEILNDGLIYDVTPSRDNVTDTDILSTTNNSSIVSIEYTSHGCVVGDYIYVNSQASPIDGITLSGQYQVYEVTDANNFTIDSGTPATGTTSGGGGAIDFDILLQNGYQDNGNITGWSGGTWNTEGESGQGWNRPRAGVGGANLRQWSLDTWGEDALACVREGKIYHWDKTNGLATRFQQVTNAPEENLFILVSQPSRHLIAFGSEVFATSTVDPLIIRWAAQETLTEWDITSTNTAGEYRLPKGNFIVGAIQTRSEILVFTNTDVYSMRYVGGNDVFQFQPLGTNVSAISQNSFIDVNGVVYWMGLDSFYIYDGVIRMLPSTIAKYVFDQDGDGRINFAQKEKTFAGLNKEFNEIWWLYQQDGSSDCEHYVKYNFVENLWDFGTMDRTVWLDKGVFSKPYALSVSSRLYAQETGKDADSQPLEAFITTAYFDIDDGENMMFVDRILPDIRLAQNRNIAISVLTKKYPHPAADVITKGPFYFDDSDNKISCRARGRQMALEFRSTATGGDFEIGKIRIGFQTDGER